MKFKKFDRKFARFVAIQIFAFDFTGYFKKTYHILKLDFEKPKTFMLNFIIFRAIL